MQEILVNGVDEKYYYDICDSGLEIYMWVNPNVSNFYATLNCHYGSLDTEFKLDGDKKYIQVPNGVAHFLEHVNFSLPNGEDATEYFNKLGSSCNAFTTYDFTSYEVFGADKFKENIDHLLNYVFTPYFTKKNVDKEKGIITSEVNMGKNNNGHVFYYGAADGIYVKDKRKIFVTGDVDDVKNTTKDDLQLVYDNFYHPKNMFIVITGNFNPYEAVAIIKENLSKKTFPIYQNPIKKREKEPIMVNIPYKEEEGNVEIPKVKITYKMDRNNFKNIDDLNLRVYLGMILRTNFGTTSDFKEMLLENELVTAISYEREINNNVLVISIIAETKYPTEVINKVREQMENLSITEDDLIRRTKCNIASLINDYDDIEYINSEIQDSLITYGELKTNMYDLYKDCEISIANKIIKEISFDNEAIFILKPKEEVQE